MRILAIDPGVCTGLSTPERSWQVTFSELSPASPHLALYSVLARYMPEAIVCERFDFRQNKRGVEYTPVEYIGVIHLFCQTTETPLHMQGQDVTSEKSFWNKKKLEYLGLYDASMVHAMDALKHRLTMELKLGIFDLNRLRDFR